MKFCKCSRAPSIPRFTGSSSKGGSRAKWSETEAGRSAKFYSLTAAGRAQLEREKQSWSRLSTAINLVVDSSSRRRKCAFSHDSAWHSGAVPSSGRNGAAQRRIAVSSRRADCREHRARPHPRRRANRPPCIRSATHPLMRDQARSTWSWNWLETILRDLRYGARTLTRSPGFTLISILVMALGIGATTSLFTIVRAVLLKPLPFAESDKLVAVYEHFRESNGGDGFNVVAPGGLSRLASADPRFPGHGCMASIRIRSHR